MIRDMIKEIFTTKEYEEAINQFSDYHFSHSLLFYNARVKEQVAFKTFAYYIGGDIIALAQVLEKPVLRNKIMLLIPFGPIVRDLAKFNLNEFLSELKTAYSSRPPVFIQIDLFSMDPAVNNKLNSLLENNTNLSKSYQEFRHADGTAVISLNKSPSEMFIEYRKDVKYNIKKVEKENQLQIDITRSKSDFDAFWDLYEATQKRKNFRDLRKSLYSNFYDEDSCFLMRAKNNGAVVAEVFCVEFKAQNTLITFLSSTTSDGNKLKAPTYLRWKLINYAYENKFAKLDFFSVDKDLGGHSSFKMGFRGEVIWFNKPKDFVIKKVNYNLLKLFSKIKEK